MPLTAIALALTWIPAGWLYVAAKTVRVGEIVCEHPEPYHYCAVKRDAWFELWVDRDHLGGLCPMAPQSQTLRYPYRIRPMIQWLPTRLGRSACFSAAFFRARDPDAPLTRNSALTAVSTETSKCTRSSTDHIEITALDDLPIEGDESLVVQVKQRSGGDPVEIVGLLLSVQIVYE